ncbi:MAG: exonuclease I [Alphaproteobacteria bacterium ADurb.Bin438]|nr:MAG: exonuclease I [Alphaproteobacteria bacterium ADurb.Bin438]
MLNDYVYKWDKTDKFQFIGYNSRFDEDFLRQFFINNADNDKDKMYGNGYGCYFYTPSLDVMQMAALKLMDNRKDLINFKLETVCNYFGITEENWHDAKADIRATKKLFKELLR